MMKIKETYSRFSSRGDTIVEVLIAIAIAGLAIGISYATAQRSLQQSITARQRNQALNLIENQIADLKLRFKLSATGTPGSFTPFESPNTHFCLDDGASDPSVTATWNPYMNDGPNGPPAQNALLAAKTDSSPGPYNPACQNQKMGDGTTYFTDIVTQPSSSKSYPTIYQIYVRWEPQGSSQSQNNQASLFYKLDGVPSS
jgi:type II secretory pathway pseudopilin PulG